MTNLIQKSDKPALTLGLVISSSIWDSTYFSNVSFERHGFWYVSTMPFLRISSASLSSRSHGYRALSRKTNLLWWNPRESNPEDSGGLNSMNIERSEYPRRWIIFATCRTHSLGPSLKWSSVRRYPLDYSCKGNDHLKYLSWGAENMWEQICSTLSWNSKEYKCNLWRTVKSDRITSWWRRSS
jgi:hypothetical protein